MPGKEIKKTGTIKIEYPVVGRETIDFDAKPGDYSDPVLTIKPLTRATPLSVSEYPVNSILLVPEEGYEVEEVAVAVDESERTGVES